MKLDTVFDEQSVELNLKELKRSTLTNPLLYFVALFWAFSVVSAILMAANVMKFYPIRAVGVVLLFIVTSLVLYSVFRILSKKYTEDYRKRMLLAIPSRVVVVFGDNTITLKEDTIGDGPNAIHTVKEYKYSQFKKMVLGNEYTILYVRPGKNQFFILPIKNAENSSESLDEIISFLRTYVKSVKIRKRKERGKGAL